MQVFVQRVLFLVSYSVQADIGGHPVEQGGRVFAGQAVLIGYDLQEYFMHCVVGGLLVFEHSTASPQDHRAVLGIKRFDIDQSLSSHIVLNTREAQNSTF